MRRRPGLTLMEVLVTLFILAFGVMAILTLFPLAASQMFIAVREDRSAQAAYAADSFFRSYWKTEVVERGRDNPPVQEAFFQAMTDPGGGRSLTPATLSEAGYPVVIDPMGYVARTGAAQSWLGDGGVTSIPRRTLNLIGTNTQHAQRLCSLMDGFGYTETGLPQEREMRYNWLWVVQRTSRHQYSADLTVVVFDNRPHLYAPAGAEAVFSTVSNGVVPGQTRVTLTPNAGVSPDIKPGAWVMDATVGGRIRQANFYQVVSVTANGANTDLELQSPLKPTTEQTASTTPYTGTFVILRGVSNVSVRRPLSAE